MCVGGERKTISHTPKTKSIYYINVPRNLDEIQCDPPELSRPCAPSEIPWGARSCLRERRGDLFGIGCIFFSFQSSGTCVVRLKYRRCKQKKKKLDLAKGNKTSRFSIYIDIFCGVGVSQSTRSTSVIANNDNPVSQPSSRTDP